MGSVRFRLKVAKGVLLIEKGTINVIIRYLVVVLYHLIIYFNHDLKSPLTEILVETVGTPFTLEIIKWSDCYEIHILIY